MTTLVDRRGVEPLTSAVQRRQPFHQQVPTSATERGCEREKSGRSVIEWHQVTSSAAAFVCRMFAIQTAFSRAKPRSHEGRAAGLT